MKGRMHMHDSIAQAHKTFANHVATLVSNIISPHMTIIDWHLPAEPDTPDVYSHTDYIRYILDHENGDLIITGDLGNSIASWYDRLSIVGFCKLTKDIPYYMSKFRCTDSDYYVKDEFICADIDALYNNILAFYDPENKHTQRRFDSKFEKIKAELINADRTKSGVIYNSNIENILTDEFGFDTSEIYELFNIKDSVINIGKRVDPRVYLWSEGLRMACSQLGLYIAPSSEEKDDLS